LVVLFLGVAALAMSSVPGPAGAQSGQEQPVRGLADRWFSVPAGAASWRVPYFGTADLTAPQPSVTRVVLIIHGTLRDADRYYAAGLAAAQAAGADPQRVVVAAPQFLATPDAAALALPSDAPSWSPNGWKDGARAVRPPDGPSSFEVLDALLDALLDRQRFPALRDIVVAGHSAGAQLVQRYAAVGRVAAAPAAGVSLRYVVANPSSYLYFDDRRVAADGSFAPYPRAVCPEFNRYKYGLEDANAYVGSPDGLALARRYAGRDVTYLLGGDDRDPQSSSLDRTCAAEAQGAFRLERGQRYVRALRLVVGPDAPLRQDLHVVPGVGHDGRAMFTSPCGLRVLFGGGCDGG